MSNFPGFDNPRIGHSQDEVSRMMRNALDGYVMEPPLPFPLEAGPELDAAVAKKCGMLPQRHEWDRHGGRGSEYPVYHCLACGSIVEAIDESYADRIGPCEIRPSTDLNAAFEAAEKCGLFHNVDVKLSKNHFDGWTVERLVAPSSDDDNGGVFFDIATGSTPALAISRAIVKLESA